MESSLITEGAARLLPYTEMVTLVGGSLMGRFAKTFGAALVLFTIGAGSTAQATWFGMPRMLKSQFDHVVFKAAVMGPFAYTHFCLRYAEDCREHGHVFKRPHPVVLTETRWKELAEINQRVNRSIMPQAYINDKTYDTWRIAPARGDCNDYAVTKRHELLTRGWPSRSVLLAEVITTWGEHHMVLIVRTDAQDFILDNLNANIKPWSKTPYEWVRMESPIYRGLWTTIKTPAEQTASL
jgi:predicted transglutaminase-like cysteine proteinase